MSDDLIRQARQAAHDVLRTLARDRRSTALDHGWNAEGSGGESVLSLVLKALGHQRSGARGRELEWSAKLAVRSVVADSIASGLAVPGRADQAPDWNSSNLEFQFTPTGRRVLAEDAVAIHNDGTLRVALEQGRAAGSLNVEDHEIELLAEAQHCWTVGCFRAAAVLIGLANESRCLSLVDAMAAALPNPTTPDLLRDLQNARDSTKAFSARWRPTLRLLERCRAGLWSAGRGQAWWQPWESVPGALSTLGEAVRTTRNTAAHDPLQVFGRADVALLLAAMPHQIGIVGSLSAFFNSRPAGVTLPTL